MDDTNTNIHYLKNIIDQAWKERDWGQFHSPKNMSCNIAREASELMELFLWCDSGKDSYQELETNKQEVIHELADVIIAAFTFANRADIDVTKAILEKLEIAKQKYPVALAKGKSTKYTKLRKEG